VGAWLAFAGAVPVYDGIDNPDEPYRWVQPQTGTRSTQAPSSATVTLKAAGGRSLDAGQATSSEVGAQVKIFLPALSLAPPELARSVTVNAVPHAPSEPLPGDGRIVTNVYRVSASASGGPVRVVGSSDRATPVIQMRAPTGRQPGPVFEYRDDGPWQRVPTTRVGVDVYQALMPGFGDWALVELRSPRSSPGGPGAAVVLAGTCAVVLAAIVVTVRRVPSSPEVPPRTRRRPRAGARGRRRACLIR
jgi:hypothetical protein